MNKRYKQRSLRFQMKMQFLLFILTHKLLEKNLFGWFLLLGSRGNTANISSQRYILFQARILFLTSIRLMSRGLTWINSFWSNNFSHVWVFAVHKRFILNLSLGNYYPQEIFQNKRVSISNYLFFLFYLTLQYCIGFAIYQNESATGKINPLSMTFLYVK